jgi:tetratricopeptide (TPR) repeat protein
MRSFDEERAMLVALAEALRSFQCLVTFNGKSFDLPLLETRYILARLPRPSVPALHLDLLHPARRLWRQRFESCSLSGLEAHVLQHTRRHDLPSWAIPGVYVDYLRTGDARALRRCFTHNLHDIVSLATLLTSLVHTITSPLTAGLTPGQVASVARLYLNTGQHDHACRLLEVALEAATSPDRERIQTLLAATYRRLGHRDRALQHWRDLSRGPAAPLALLELAKHYEHHERDIHTARRVVEEALAILDLRHANCTEHPSRYDREELERRLARLIRKQNPTSSTHPHPRSTTLHQSAR